MVMSPSAGFAAMVLAALLAAVPAMFGRRRLRITAFVLVVVSVVFAVSVYPDFRKDRERYREATEASGEVHKPAAPTQSPKTGR